MRPLHLHPNFLHHHLTLHGNLLTVLKTRMMIFKSLKRRRRFLWMTLMVNVVEHIPTITPRYRGGGRRGRRGMSTGSWRNMTGKRSQNMLKLSETISRCPPQVSRLLSHRPRPRKQSPQQQVRTPDVIPESRVTVMISSTSRYKTYECHFTRLSRICSQHNYDYVSWVSESDKLLKNFLLTNPSHQDIIEHLFALSRSRSEQKRE